MFSPALREFIAVSDDARRLGPYRCKELLDKAGTAPVFKAFEEHAGRQIREVAVKVFDAEARVLDEARTLCRVQHPNVIRFHTLSTDTKRGLMGLVMELAEGINLDKQLETVQDRIALAVEVGVSISSALAAAHEAGIVHCNVKPSNVMFTDGTHKLINFGIAASLGAAPEKGTARSVALDDLAPESIGQKASTLAKDAKTAIPGTIGYADPVCIATTAPPTAASDLYSLGAILYQCASGKVPAMASGTLEKKVITGDATPASLAEVAPNALPALVKLIDALVSPKREGRPRSADAVRRELERIRSLLAGRERVLPPEERGPFPGLDRYEASDRDVFFGRSAEIAGLVELCRTRGLVGIVGLSGSGKSSITRAGLVPAIEEGALGGWPSKYRSVVITPGKNLMSALESALADAIGAPLAKHPEAIVEQLSADVDAKGEGIVLLIDQLEEIVLKHGGDEDARRRALDLLSRLAEAPVGLRAIVVVRRDVLDEVLAVDPHFSRALSRGIQVLAPLTGSAWEEVIDQSIDAYGYSFAKPELRKEVLAELEATAMTLGQFGLTRLWAERDSKAKTITRGSMKGALEAHADAAVAKIPKDKLRDVLLAMTTPEGTRAHVELERFDPAAKEAVFALTKARLVASEKPGFTFVHDSILREWPLLRRWIEDARDDRQLLAHIERDAARWASSKDSAELWRKGRLAAAIEMWKRGDASLTDDARAFLTKSANEAAKVRVAFGFLVSLVVLLIVGGSLIYAKESRERAEQAQRDAQALSAALAEVKTLKQQADESAAENSATAKLIHDLQTQMAAQVDVAVKKVASATSLEGAKRATDDLKAQNGPSVPLPLDLSNLNLSATSSGGPKLDGSGPSPSAGGGTFDQGSIERVVNARKAGVKRTCLERSAGTASSTKVTASLTIAPNGTVQSVSTTGDEPAVGKCIEQQLRGWSFPPPGEVKQVQIPFVFVRQ